MPIQGIHVACTRVGPPGDAPGSEVDAYVTWSETLPTAGQTRQSVAPLGDRWGRQVFRVFCAVDAFVAVGDWPDASRSPRSFIPAGHERDLYAMPGERLAWSPA